jgi:hypothetical protein
MWQLIRITTGVVLGTTVLSVVLMLCYPVEQETAPTPTPKEEVAGPISHYC